VKRKLTKFDKISLCGDTDTDSDAQISLLAIMRFPATRRLFKEGLDSGCFRREDTVLTVGGSAHEEKFFSEMGFDNVPHTNLGGEHPVDARALPFSPESFDLVFTEATLHHLDKPHQAIYEMVRVSRCSVVICKTQDNLMMQVVLRLCIAEDYELSAVKAHGGKSGGVNDTHVPNFVYRWRNGELVKVFQALDRSKAAGTSVTYAWDSY